MPNHISYPDTNLYRALVMDVNRKANFVGLDSDGNPIVDNSRPKPIIEFFGTIKLHGTNSSICFDTKDGLWAQSRENIIYAGKSDNAGFAFFVESHKDVCMNLIEKVYIDNNLSPNEYTVSIYGEFAGKGINSGVAICNIEKSFFIFGVKISKPDDPDYIAYWVDCKNLRSPENRIYNIYDYKTYEITIDFNHPELSQAELDKIVEEVETECPVAKAFGISGVGEGVVFRSKKDWKGNNYLFKAKGEKHAATQKVKTSTPVDDERLAKIQEIADLVTPAWRLEQALKSVCGAGEINRKYMSDYLKWVINDVIKEELAVLSEANLELKDVNSKIAEIARNYFFEYEKNFYS